MKDDRPNIVLIFADDLGYGDVGCYGAGKLKTPNIDSLARQGRMFTDAHAASAVCTPSRYCLLTGQYAFRINNWSPVFHQSGLIIDTRRLTLPKLLKKHGYATACIGKWHLGFGKGRPDWNARLKPGPLEVGFDYYFGIPVVSSHPPFVYVQNHRVVGLEADDPLVFDPNTDPRHGRGVTRHYPEKYMQASYRGGTKAQKLYQDEQLGTTLTEKAVEWMTSHVGHRPDEPFFLYFPTPHIHHPFTPAPRFNGTSRCGRYGDFIHELDWMVGEVTKTLDKLKIADNTLVIFTSDNGGMLNAGGKDAWRAGHRLNGKLLGFKFGAWEGGHRIPFIARWPGKIKPSSRSDQLMGNVDMTATIAAMLGCELKPGDAPDSYNVLPVLVGEPKEPIRDHLIQACQQQRLALRKGKWVYVEGQGSGGFGNGLKEIAFTKQKNSDVTLKGTIRKGAPPNQLYDLEADPYQETNLYEKHPDVAARMQADLQEYRAAGRTRP